MWWLLLVHGVACVLDSLSVYESLLLLLLLDLSVYVGLLDQSCDRVDLFTWSHHRRLVHLLRQWLSWLRGEAAVRALPLSWPTSLLIAIESI